MKNLSLLLAILTFCFNSHANPAFNCSVKIDSEQDQVEVELSPISEWETYMLEGVISNLYISATVGSALTSFDLQVSQAPYLFDPTKDYKFDDIVNDLTQVLRVFPAFDILEEDGTKTALVQLNHFINPTAYPPMGAYIPVVINCEVKK